MSQIHKDSPKYLIASKLFMEMQKRGIFQIAFHFHGGGDDGTIEQQVMIYHNKKINLSDIPIGEYALTETYPPDELCNLDIIFDFVEGEKSFNKRDLDDFLYTDCIKESFDGEPMVEGTLVIDLIEAKIVKAVSYEVRVTEVQPLETIEVPSLKTSIISSDLANEI